MAERSFQYSQVYSGRRNFWIKPTAGKQKAWSKQYLVPDIWTVSSDKVPSNMRKMGDSDHPAHAQSIIRVFAVHSFFLWYPVIMLADSEGPDLGLRCPHMLADTFSPGEAHINNHIPLIPAVLWSIIQCLFETYYKPFANWTYALRLVWVGSAKFKFNQMNQVSVN